MRIKQATVIAVTLLTVSNIAFAEDLSPSAVGSSLPANIRALLIQEMGEVRDASGKIFDALIRGQDEIVAANAQAIHDSFIMAKKMSETDKKKLVSTVPATFLAKDKAFHKLSADLAAAARSGDQVLQNKLFGQLINACTACHSAHATDRFPEFSVEK